MKKIGFLGLFLSIFISNILAVDAYPGLIRFRQPDKKTVVSIYMKGDEKVHWAETIDGYSLITNNEGYFVYATLDENEDLVPTKYIATDVEERSSEVLSFLSHTPKHLLFSRRQVSAMQSIWTLTKEQEKMKYDGDVVGEKRILVILMGFKDQPFSIAPMFVRNMFNQVNYSMNYARGSVRDFYYENSYGQFTLTATVAGPYVADSNMAYYGNNYDGDARQLAHEAFVAASNDVDYSLFDNDNNGILDGAHILFAGMGEEAGGGADCIWSHKWNLSESLEYNGITISTYSCSPEFQGNETNRLTNIGVICHELGHVFGSPDYYDTDYASNGGDYPGNGKWDLMSSGSWNGNGVTPAHHNPYTKIHYYRWANPTVLDTHTTVILSPAETDSNSFYIINTATDGEYYIIENRQKTGFDRSLPHHGMMVYHIHPQIRYYNINIEHPQRMYPLYSFSEVYYPNSDPSSYGDINTTACPFSHQYGRTTLNDYTMPWIRDWDTNTTGVSIEHIWENGDKIYFKMNNALPEPLEITANAKSANSVELKWQRYSTYEVMVVCSKQNNFGTPADSNYRVGDIIENGDTVIYVGTAASFTQTGLQPNSAYYYKIYTKTNKTTYTQGIETMALTYCNTIAEYPYTEDFDNDINTYYKKEQIAGNGILEVNNSLLTYLSQNSSDSASITRLTLNPFDLSGCQNAVMKLKLNINDTNKQNNAVTVCYKSKATDQWQTLQRYKPNTNAEVMLNLPKLSDFYLISLLIENSGNNPIAIDRISIDTYSDSGYIVVASTNGYGSLSPQGVTLCSQADSITFEILPADNCRLDSIYVNGQSVTAEGNTYTFANIGASQTIYATFVSLIGIHDTYSHCADINIYPNPAKEKITIYNNTNQKTNCIIYTVDGKAIITKHLHPQCQTTINTSQLKPGMYIVKLIGNSFEKTEKLIIAE